MLMFPFSVFCLLSLFLPCTFGSAVALDNAPIQTAVSTGDSVVPDNHQSSYNENAPSPTSGPLRASTKHSKKQKNETDRGKDSLLLSSVMQVEEPCLIFKLRKRQ